MHELGEINKFSNYMKSTKSGQNGLNLGSKCKGGKVKLIPKIWLNLVKF